MKVINLKKCPSTQAYLTSLISKFPEFISGPTLVTTKQQTSGFGRKGNDWEFFENSIAMSFTLNKETYNHLTPLAIGVHLAEFFRLKNIKITLKWPNDLMDTSRKKVGGIICQQVNDLIVCGVGINLNQKETRWSSIKTNEEPEDLAKEIYQQILRINFTKNEVMEKWNFFCCHLNQAVEIVDDKTNAHGRFIGIDRNGSAQIDNTLEIKTISSGSLFFR